MSQQKSDHVRGIVELLPKRGKHSKTIKLKHPATIIGREKADIIVRDAEVSASHCQIQDIDGEFFIFDMNSTNGTYINDKKVVKSQLTPQDIIRIGKTKLRFNVVNAQQASAIPMFDKYRERRSPHYKTMLETLLAEVPKRPYLVKMRVTYPDNTSELLKIRRKEMHIGRDSFNGNFASDPRVSSRHLLIKINKHGEVFIKDQNSRHGTFINDERINSYKKITSEDTVRIGDTLLKIVA